MPDEACDGRNVALKFSSDCWRARLSKTELLHQNFQIFTTFQMRCLRDIKVWDRCCNADVLEECGEATVREQL